MPRTQAHLYKVRNGDIRTQTRGLWLLIDMRSSEAYAGFLAGFRGLLRRHIGHGGLNADAAAELVTMSRWQLARQLTLQGTDISSEIARAKWDVAKERLIHGQQTIEEISSALGCADPANFSRAFAREFQQTPSKYRRAQRTQAT